MRIVTICIIALRLPVDVRAIDAPNAAGVTLGHIHLIVKDVDAQTRFLVDMMAGTVVEERQADRDPSSGVYVLLAKETQAGRRTRVDHFGFIIRTAP